MLSAPGFMRQFEARFGAHRGRPDFAARARPPPAFAGVSARRSALIAPGFARTPSHLSRRPHFDAAHWTIGDDDFREPRSMMPPPPHAACAAAKSRRGRMQGHVIGIASFRESDSRRRNTHGQPARLETFIVDARRLFGRPALGRPGRRAGGRR